MVPITSSVNLGFVVPTPTEPPAPTTNLVLKKSSLTLNKSVSDLLILKYCLLPNPSTSSMLYWLLYALVWMALLKESTVEAEDTTIESMTCRFPRGIVVPIPTLPNV